MALKRVARRSISDEVFDQLLGEVVRGELRPGQPLPAERHLAEVFGVSRPTVREAVQRLAHAGVVEVRQGDVTTVMDFSRHAGPDLIPLLLFSKGELDIEVLRSILEARLIIGREISVLAARRPSPELARALRDAVETMNREPDPVRQQQLALTYWERVVDGADSIVFRSIFNTFGVTYGPTYEALATVMTPEPRPIEAYRVLTDAITAGDLVRTRDAAQSLLTQVNRALLAAVERLDSRA